MCEDETQLAKEVLDDFTLRIFSGCQKLLEDLPDTVYKACKLLAAVARRNGAVWRDKVLAEVMEQVSKMRQNFVWIFHDECQQRMLISSACSMYLCSFLPAFFFHFQQNAIF